jgi:hypothetical protein
MISSTGDVSDEEVMKKFGQICGQKLKCIYENSNEEQDLMKICRLTPNLEKIHFSYRNYDFSNEIYFCELKEISFSFNPDLNQFKSFTSIYRKQIKKISLEVRSEIISFLDELSRFEKLENLQIRIRLQNSLNLDLEIENLFNPKANGLNSIAKNCKSLRNLRIDVLFFVCNNHLKDKNLCELFSGFNALEKLTLYLKLNNINVEPLKNCEKLKYLELNAYHLRSKALENIDLYLPNLKTIVIHFTFDYRYNSGIFRKLSKCKNLTKLVIYVENSQIFDSLINYVLKICSNIREIYFDGIHFQITRKTLDLLNNYAKNNPKFDYEFNNKLNIRQEYMIIEYLKKKKFYNLYVKNW